MDRIHQRYLTNLPQGNHVPMSSRVSGTRGPRLSFTEHIVEDPSPSDNRDQSEYHDQFEQLWRLTTRLEQHAHRTEADRLATQGQLREDRASLESRLQGLEYDRISHARHLQRIEDEKPLLHRQMRKLEETFEFRLRRLETSDGNRARGLSRDVMSLETRLQELKASWEEHLRGLENSYEARLRQLEDDKEDLKIQLEQSNVAYQSLEDRLCALEDSVIHKRSRRASSTPSFIDLTHPAQSSSMSREDSPDDTMNPLKFHGLRPLKLHPRFPGVFFLVDPETNEVSDGSNWPATLISDLRNILTEKASINSVKCQSQLREIQGITTAKRCLIPHLTQASRTPSVWTKDFPRLYACRACVNTRRLCMTIAQNQIVVLPLHPLLRTRAIDNEIRDEDTIEDSDFGTDNVSACSTEIGYWIAPKSLMTRRTPYDVPIWSA